MVFVLLSPHLTILEVAPKTPQIFSVSLSVLLINMNLTRFTLGAKQSLRDTHRPPGSELSGEPGPSPGFKQFVLFYTIVLMSQESAIKPR